MKNLIAVLVLAGCCFAADGPSVQSYCVSPAMFNRVGIPVPPGPDYVQVIATQVPPGIDVVALVATIGEHGEQRTVEQLARTYGATMAGTRFAVSSCDASVRVVIGSMFKAVGTGL